jgi:ABC-type phosphate/phosphonate transport system substrate-binding protein
MVFPIIAGAVGGEDGITTQRVASATTINGNWIDTSKYEGNLIIFVNCGAASASDTADFTVVESDVASGSGTAVPADALFNPATAQPATFTQVTDAGASFQALALKLERIARYIRVNATTAGSGIAIDLSVTVAGAKKYVV